EVVACGDDAALAQLERWLELGPPLAQVSHVVRTTADIAAPERFRIA
ncbi:MAG TPA: acylphosphatase, partial [Rhodanobacteraceae bacterium]|nr:acylphosphatase [Rhodanobacteraceae bacterium]